MPKILSSKNKGVRVKTYERDNYTCLICSKELVRRYNDKASASNTANLHHVFSHYKGRKLGLTIKQLNDTHNLVTVCHDCHDYLDLFEHRKKHTVPDRELLEQYEKIKAEIGFYEWLAHSVTPSNRNLQGLNRKDTRPALNKA